MTQKEALAFLKIGANVFLTGEPGSGKTHTINEYVKYLRAHGIEPAITASTGIASTHIGGMTIHAWSGIGIKKFLSENDLDELCQRERLVSRVSKTKVLIIDEISMLDSQTLTAVDMACKALRRRDEPFGGMQTVFVGDFFQLPPVNRAGQEISLFAYLAPVWQEAEPIVCYLSEQHRTEDASFLKFLSAIRSGEITEDIHKILQARITNKTEHGNATRLYAHNVNVDRVNIEKLNALTHTGRTFSMSARGGEYSIESLKKSCLSPESLSLKVGAQVMFTKNVFESGYVNGTLGEVESFTADGDPVVRTKKGKRIQVVPQDWTMSDGTRVLATISQIPLRLAWAITVHKSQGMTLDEATIDLREAFEYGQGYVALSRVRSFSGLSLLGYNARALEVHPEVASVDSQFKEASLKAENSLDKIVEAEQMKLEHNFIHACGGSVDPSKVKKKKSKSGKISVAKVSTYDQTLSLCKDGKSVEEIAKQRDVTKGTIIGHLETLFMRGDLDIAVIKNIIPKELVPQIPKISAAFIELKTEILTPVFEKLNSKVPFEDLRLVRLYMMAERATGDKKIS